jgi:uncharacterized protein (TIGR02301 family)
MCTVQAKCGMLSMRPAVLPVIMLSLALAIGAAGAQEPDVTEDPDTPEASESTDGVEGPPPPPAELPPPVYDTQLLRLSEILGSLAFLRGLCGEPDGPAWRDEMSALLAAEQPGPERRSRLVGHSITGFETYNAVYRSCTPSARLAITRYLAEGTNPFSRRAEPL